MCILLNRSTIKSCQTISSAHVNHDSDFEDIVVKRQEEQRDPEAEAEFDRELAKMMSEGLDSRKFERKPLFDVPLPIRKTQKETSLHAGDDSGNEGSTIPPSSNTMAFSLMTRKGGRQQAIIPPKFLLRLYSYYHADEEY